ncbi:hypothetical protein O3P69_001109 [Scylla paramamosain]|uniref:Uncharacterized protein n=1 Tax=Scylla paramamosain TaxID=85552 RepID=A0AAW0UPV9_SCYPA
MILIHTPALREAREEVEEIGRGRPSSPTAPPQGYGAFVQTLRSSLRRAYCAIRKHKSTLLCSEFTVTTTITNFAGDGGCERTITIATTITKFESQVGADDEEEQGGGRGRERERREESLKGSKIEQINNLVNGCVGWGMLGGGGGGVTLPASPSRAFLNRGIGAPSASTPAPRFTIHSTRIQPFFYGLFIAFHKAIPATFRHMARHLATHSSTRSPHQPLDSGSKHSSTDQPLVQPSTHPASCRCFVSAGREGGRDAGEARAPRPPLPRRS